MAQSDMDIALEQVRRAAKREAFYSGPMITTFMGYTVEQILAMRDLIEAVAKNDPYDMAGDGIMCAEVWQKTAQSILSK